MVTPTFTEVNVSGGQPGTVFKVLWDGTDYLVAYLGSDGLVARRVSPTGAIVDATPFVLDPATQDIAFANGEHLVVTVEPGNAATYPDQWIGGYRMRPSGAPLSVKKMLLWNPGNICPPGPADPGTLVEPVVAGSSTSFAVVAGFQYCYALLGDIGGTAFGLGSAQYRPRHARLAGSARGFAVLTQEGNVGGGSNEPWMATFSPTGQPVTGYANMDPVVPGDPNCCVNALGVVAGATNYLMAFTRVTGTMTFEPATSTPSGVKVTVPGMYSNYTEPAMGFDGSNYLVVASQSGTGLPGYRITPAGDKLDAQPIPLTSDPTPPAWSPVKLGYDRAGRYALGFTKNSDGNAYLRLFSTCP